MAAKVCRITFTYRYNFLRPAVSRAPAALFHFSVFVFSGICLVAFCFPVFFLSFSFPVFFVFGGFVGPDFFLAGLAGLAGAVFLRGLKAGRFFCFFSGRLPEWIWRFLFSPVCFFCLAVFVFPFFLFFPLPFFSGLPFFFPFSAGFAHCRGFDSLLHSGGYNQDRRLVIDGKLFQEAKKSVEPQVQVGRRVGLQAPQGLGWLFWFCHIFFFTHSVGLNELRSCVFWL